MASEEGGAPRSRTVAWEDPMRGAAAARGLSGLDYLRAMASGEAR